MKKIALDLDGVVFDSETLYRVYSEMYDVDVLKCDNLIDNSMRRAQERYNWDESEFDNFMKIYNEEVVNNANLMTGVEVILKELSKYYEFIIVTARTDREMQLSKDVLEKIGLGNAKIINNDLTKVETLIREKCDYIIDDNETVCNNAYESGIIPIYFRNPACLKHFNKEIITVNNWGEIYKYLMLKN